MRRTALVIIGHGTRDPQGVAEFRELVAKVAAAAPEWIVEPCFLELAEPDVARGLDRAVERGATEVVALPLLLFAAGHAKRDVPELLFEASHRHPSVSYRQAPHLGCHADLVELSAQRYRESDPPAAENTLLLLIGRGSYDPTANAEMAQFARLRWEAERTAWYEVGFTAMAEPGLERAIQVAGAMPFSHVVVQPHLLFAGELLDRIGVAVRAAADRFPEQSWSVTPHLGPSDLLVSAVLDRARCSPQAFGGVTLPPK
ncbi:MAG: sirohydrochlorin chelatase [Planctomycetia bacterium]|nr:sirohydrochlorin chelatase [Planctomycetia bacterium]